MIRIYVPSERIKSEEKIIRLESAEAHYLVSVMRLKDESFCVFDGNGNEYRAVVEKTKGKKEAAAKILSHAFMTPENKTSIALAVCLLKGGKMDFVLQKATELGVTEIIPVLSARTISRVKPAEWGKKKIRYSAIVKEAAEQCGKTTLPEIAGLILLDAIKHAVKNFQLSLFFNEHEKQNTLSEVLKKNKNAASVLFLVGPEGGFTENEARMLVESGFVSVILGQNILRSETACVFGLSVLTYEFMA